jgi:hypothetical protein
MHIINLYHVPFSARCAAVQHAAMITCSDTHCCSATLPHRFVCTLALAGQSLDSNATLGNADLAYKFHYFDGVVLPVGLGVSLFLNGILLVRFTALNITLNRTVDRTMSTTAERLHWTFSSFAL